MGITGALVEAPAALEVVFAGALGFDSSCAKTEAVKTDANSSATDRRVVD
jgi:hypothetical protein